MHYPMKPSLLKLLGTVLLVGCADTSGRLAISGNVSYDGQPLPNGTIGFAPQDASTGKAAGAEIIDGRYEISHDDGPLAGTYQVRVYAERPTGRKLQADEGSSETIDQMVQYIPPLYNDRTTLTAELTADREDLDFTLEKPKRGRR